jgi:hypothetical protein
MKTNQQYSQTIPTCPGCKGQMLLITQTFSPIDFIVDLDDFDSSKPIVSCYTSTIVKKYAASKSLHSSNPNAKITINRHARTLYVFACSQGLCAYNPGAWKTISMVQSEPKIIYLGTNGLMITDTKKLAAATSVTIDNSHIDDGVGICGDEDEDEDDGDYDDMEDIDYEDEDEDGDEDGEGEKVASAVVLQPALPLAPPTTPSFVTQSNTLNSKHDAFAVGGWSDDDDDDDDDNDTSAAATIESLQKMVQETVELQLKSSGRSEKQMKEDIEMAKIQKKNKKLLAKGQTRAPIVVEPKSTGQVSHVNQDGELIPVHSTPDDITFLRPFYLLWTETKNRPKTDDFSKEKELLRQYYTQPDDNDDASIGNNNHDEQGGTDNEDEDQEEDPYESYQDAINDTPDQVIRYFNSNLSLHQLPEQDSLDNFKKEAKSHQFQKFTTQSGVWLLHDVPKCACCGDNLVLECQILPTLLSEIKLDEFEAQYHRARFPLPTPTQKRTDEQSEPNTKAKKATKEEKMLEKKFDFDWGIVNVYSCLNMCSPDEYLPGFCLIQPGI